MDVINLKIKLRNKILKIYKEKGYAYAINTTNHLIKNANAKAKEVNDTSLPVQIRGECCEIILELQILEFAKRHNLPWFLSKGLTIPRTDGKKMKTTELDLTLFTPSKIVLFESKYRKGNIRLIDECVIVPDYGNVTDVYKQNVMHLENLKNLLGKAYLNNPQGKPFSVCLYMDTNKRVEDERSAKYKTIFPLITSENIHNYLINLSKDKIPRWDIQRLLQIVKVLDSHSEELFSQHLKAMKGKEKTK